MPLPAGSALSNPVRESCGSRPESGLHTVDSTGHFPGVLRQLTRLTAKHCGASPLHFIRELHDVVGGEFTQEPRHFGVGFIIEH